MSRSHIINVLLVDLFTLNIRLLINTSEYLSKINIPLLFNSVRVRDSKTDLSEILNNWSNRKITLHYNR